MPGVLLPATVRDTGKRCVRGGYKPQQRTGIAGLLDETGDGRIAQFVHMSTRRGPPSTRYRKINSTCKIWVVYMCFGFKERQIALS